MRRLIGVLAMAVGAWLAVADNARAGTYDVYGCRLPDGAPTGATGGWQPFVTSYLNGGVRNECATGGPLLGAFDEFRPASESAMAGWQFEAPRGTIITGYRLHRTGLSADPPGEYEARDPWFFHDATLIEQNYVEHFCLAIMQCTVLGDARFPLAPANLFERDGLRVLRLFYVSRCQGPYECRPAGSSSVSIWSSRVTLDDPYPPRFSRSPAGALTVPGSVVDGEVAVHFAGDDLGSGIASTAFIVDGQLMDDVSTLSVLGTCSRPYLVSVPCPPSLDRTMALDTTRIANGEHTVQVVLIDAAGNRTASDPVNVEVRNRGVPNGAGASQYAQLDVWFASRGTARRTAGVVTYRRTRAITGRLSNPEGAPIVGAALDVSATTGRPGSRAKVIGQVVTDGNGAFNFSPKAGSSRRITVSYRAYTLDSAASATSDVTLQTRAGVRLTVSPRRVGPRGAIRFTGRLLGGPGRAGTQVVIYALGGSRSRIPVATVRADSRGRFRYRYRFSNSAPGTTYRFQATLHAQRSYPYATGHSRTVAVRIK